MSEATRRPEVSAPFIRPDSFSRPLCGNPPA